MNPHKLHSSHLRPIPLRTCIINRYFDLNRILLLGVGLWPYHQSKLGRFHLMVFLGILISFIVFQFSRFIFVDYTFDFVVKISSFALLFVMVAIVYVSIWINQVVKYLIDQLEYMYEELKDENEIAILDKYGSEAKRYTTKLMLLTVCSLFPPIYWAFTPIFLDIIARKNESYAQHFIEITRTFFVAQEKYVYLIIFHMSIAICISAFAMIAIATIFIGYFKQICGMFKIARYRIKRAMAINISENVSLKNQILMYKGIICAVDIHRIAMECVTYVISICDRSLLAVIGVGVCCLSLNLFRIVYMISYNNEIYEVICMHIVVVIVVIVCMFSSNYIGQEITDHNNTVFVAAYNVQWYLAPVHVQKLILVLLQRGNKTFHLKVCGVLAASLECFASLASASVSYFTVMLSLQ